MGRNEELQDFLKRVEEYDSQRKVVDGTTSNNLGAYSQESIERAKKLLQNGITIVDESSTTSTLDASDLAYSSAYNYERTFSPKKLTAEEKTYVVSEEDYLLLQRLKAKEKTPPPLPNRGRAREKHLEKLLVEDKPPALPSRKYQNLSLSVEENENFQSFSNEKVKSAKSDKPPVPPKSRSSLKTLETVFAPHDRPTTLKSSPQVDVSSWNESSSEKTAFASEKSQLKDMENSPRKLDLKSSPRKFNLKAELEPLKSNLVPNSTQPSLAPRSPRIDFLKSTQGKQSEPPAKTTSFKVKQLGKSTTDGFINSISNSTTPKQSEPLKLSNPAVLPKTGSESFINSAIKTSPHSSSLGGNYSNFKITPKSGSESFLTSALKSSPAAKPVKPPKPVSLAKQLDLRSGDSNFIVQGNPQKPAGPTAPKQKPKVPPKKSEIELPKLRHVSPSGSGPAKNNFGSVTDFTNQLKRVESPKVYEKETSQPEALAKLGHLSKPPPSPKRQDEVPEALSKLGHLSKPAISPKRENDVPEALSHLEKLNKVSKQPPVPTRKISMAEALQRARELKEQKQMQAHRPEPEQPRDMKTELGAVLMAQKLKSSKPFIAGRPHTEPSSNNSSTLSLGRTQSTPPTPTVFEKTVPQTLTHANKRRARGPKRKLPSNVKA